MKARIFYLLALAFFPAIVYAQLQGQQKIDSLLKELPRQKNDAAKAEIDLSLSRAYQFVDPAKGIEYGSKALSIAEQLKSDSLRARADGILGLSYFNMSEYAKATEYMQAALKINKAHGNKKGQAGNLNDLGMVYGEQNNYPKSLEYFFEALNINEQIGNKDWAGRNMVNIGNIYLNEGNLNKALEYHQKGLKVFEELNNKNLIAMITLNIGDIYVNMKNYPMALDNLNKALQMLESLGAKAVESSCYLSMGKVYTGQGKMEQAMECYLKGRDIAKEFEDKSRLAAAYGYLGEIYFDLSKESGNRAQLYKAKAYADSAIGIGKEIGDLETLWQNNLILSGVDSLMGDYKGAFIAHQQYTLYKDSIFSKDNAMKIGRLEAKSEYDKKHFADSLKNEEVKHTASLKLRNQRRLIYLGGAAVLVLLVFIYFIVKERRKSERLLLNILPSEVAEELKRKGEAEAMMFDHVTVLFTDFVNFTAFSEHLSPKQLVDELHSCFKAFDEIISKYNIEKIKTVGDAYLAVAGLPVLDNIHAAHVVSAAQEIRDFMLLRKEQRGDKTFEVRIGIHSGSVVAGIVGVKKFAYDIWGDTVNIAARMEQNGEPGKINISQTTYELVKDKFKCTYRGEVDAKNKGKLSMYFVES